MKKNYKISVFSFSMLAILCVGKLSSQNLEIKPATNVWVSESTLVHLGGNLATAGNFTFNSDALFFINGTSTGNVRYNRSLPTNTFWYMASAPFDGQQYDDSYISTYQLAAGTGPNRGIGTYNLATNRWNYFQAGGAAQPFTKGIGYTFKKDPAATERNISFLGTVHTADVPVFIGQGKNNHNLLGNPFPTFFDTNSFLMDNMDDLLDVNIWVWDDGERGPKPQPTDTSIKNYGPYYTVYVILDDYFLAPAQAFFIRVKPAVNKTINLKESYQIASGQLFTKTGKAQVKLSISDSEATRFARFYFLNDATNGFDNGYDGEIFGNTPNQLDLYSKLIDETSKDGKKYQLQSLPLNDINDVVIPIGVTSDANNEVTFKFEYNNLPNGVSFYLEDAVTNTITKMDDLDASYKVKFTEAINGFGRFYLHTKPSSVLGTDDVNFKSVSIFKTTNNTVRITGLTDGTDNKVKIYNLLGSQVLKTDFVSNGVKDIVLPKLSVGIYVVELENNFGKLNKKIIIE